MQISTFNPIDPRSKWEKISRRQMRKGLKNLGINFSVEYTHDQLVDVAMNAQLTPEQVAKFVTVRFNTPQGEVTQSFPEEKQPTRTEQEEHRRMEIFEQRIEAAAEKVREEEARKAAEAAKKAQSEVQELKEQIAELTKLLTSGQVSRETKKETDPHKMKFMAFKKWCKDKGYDLKKGEKREEVIAYLEKADGEDDT